MWRAANSEISNALARASTNSWASAVAALTRSVARPMASNPAGPKVSLRQLLELFTRMVTGPSSAST